MKGFSKKIKHNNSIKDFINANKNEKIIALLHTAKDELHNNNAVVLKVYLKNYLN